MTDRDALLDRVVAELKQPIEVDAAARRRLSAAVRAGRPRRRSWRLGGVFGAGALVRRPAVLALAAGVGAVAVGLWLAGAGPEPADATDAAAAHPRPVRFVLAAPAERGVSLVGDFNDWDRDATPLERTGAGDEWSVTVRLAPGRHAYAFVVDGTEWVPDPSAPRAPDDGFGIPGSVILVAGPT